MTTPPLSRSLILSEAYRDRPDLLAPEKNLLELPEKIVQIGTGAFLRGFVDYFVDGANRTGAYAGRVVAVSSTGSGRANHFNDQDGLYSLIVRGKEHGETVERASIVSSVSRAISAMDDWLQVLKLAENPELEAIVSNTTEIGITMSEDDGPHAPPQSFPGKIAAFLHARARAFEFDPEKALVILPCELLEHNGERLRDIVMVLAKRWSDRREFMSWLESCVFCNTLVDRIVPGRPGDDEVAALTERFGYRDALLTVAEPYRLWAIEGDPDLKQRLGFLSADDGIVVTNDISPYRELKVRILNGTHTMMVPAALQYGLETVRDAVTDPVLGRFLRQAMFEEIVPGLDVDQAASRTFAEDVLDRFDNPFINHPLRSIMLQATMKTRVRVVPSIRSYIERFGETPPALTLGFALFLLIRRNDNPADYPPDDLADRIRNAWNHLASEEVEGLGTMVHELLADEELWLSDLTQLPGFEAAVASGLRASLGGVHDRLDAFAKQSELE